MIAEIVVHTFLVSGILTLAGLVVESMMRGRGHPRRWGWMGVIAGSAAITVGLLLAYPGPPAAEPVEENGVTFVLGTVTDLGNPDAIASPSLPVALFRDGMRGWQMGLDGLASMTGTLAKVLERNPVGEMGLALIWAILSIVALGILIISALRLRGRTGGLPVETVGGRAFVVADALGPAVVGFVRPKIVLPRWLLASPTETLSMVVTHEEEHLRARDTLLLAGGLGAMVLAPWNPFVWIQLSRLRLAIELDCDARVVRRGVSSTRYAAVLLDVGSRTAPLPVGATALAEPPHFLERRMKTLVAPFTKISLPRASLIGSIAILLFVAAFNTPTPANGSESTNDSGSTASIEGVERIETIETIDGPRENSVPSPVVTSDTLDANSSNASIQVPNSVCMRGPDGDTGCTELSGNPDSHVVCSTDDSGIWGCVEVPGARASAQVCVVAQGMNLCADSTITYESMDIRSGVVAPQRDVTEAVIERLSRQDTVLRQTPQDISANPTFTVAERYPTIRNTRDVQAALVREYPAELRDQGISGQVLMHVFVDATGAVADCRVSQSSGYAELDNAALRVCPVFIFVPARNNGEAVPVWVQIPIFLGANLVNISVP